MKSTPKPEPPARPPTPTATRDVQLARAAATKIKAGKTPTKSEEAALRRLTAAREQESRLAHYQSVPKKDYIAMSGRQTKILHEQAQIYGLPLRGETIDLYALLPKFHDVLKNFGKQIREAMDEDGLVGALGGDSPALEELRKQKAILAKLDVQERRGELIRRARVHEILAACANAGRQTGEALQAQFGEEARLAFDGFLLTLKHQAQETLAHDSGDPHPSDLSEHEDHEQPAHAGIRVDDRPVPDAPQAQPARIRRARNNPAR